MSSSAPPKSSRDRVRKHRKQLRKQGLRPIQIWVPDVRSEEFRQQAHEQSLAVAESAREAQDQAFIDAISVWNDEPGEDA